MTLLWLLNPNSVVNQRGRMRRRFEHNQILPFMDIDYANIVLWSLGSWYYYIQLAKVGHQPWLPCGKSATASRAWRLRGWQFPSRVICLWKNSLHGRGRRGKPHHNSHPKYFCKNVDCHFEVWWHILFCMHAYCDFMGNVHDFDRWLVTTPMSDYVELLYLHTFSEQKAMKITHQWR